MPQLVRLYTIHQVEATGEKEQTEYLHEVTGTSGWDWQGEMASGAGCTFTEDLLHSASSATGYLFYQNGLSMGKDAIQEKRIP